MKKLNIDIMVQRGRKFYATMTYEYNPLFKFDFEDVAVTAFKKYPTLKYRKDVELVIY